ncbi:LEA_3 domain-containing protein [Cephalotus follicularis]|uniref:LEA_3 domain-containing protein n=1 Tax=Cephalotus follicularis TaxID=3775 RepID=A0A1Q3BGA2_CEPFO|nr:LEA_3 domain-containing protein [Cephalotus follicularis]
MARSFSNAKLLSALVADGVSNSIFRRGYAAASQGAVNRGTSTAAKSGAMVKITKEGSKEVSWVPDPVTGHYRPDNLVKEIDAAELRNNLLKKN